MYDLTVIILTLNEESNIGKIIAEVNRILHENAINGKILVVDDNSTDKTIEIVSDLTQTYKNLDILIRAFDHGLSHSAVDGFCYADSDIFIVMDADFSHPPVVIPDMFNGIVAGNDVVIGSRYIKGGRIRTWPLKRRIVSLGATFLGRLLFPGIADPVSGFFAVRKTVVENARLNPRGYKILLELLGKGQWKKCSEIPIEFIDRNMGTSKLKLKTIVEFVWQVMDIMYFSILHHDSAARMEWKRVFQLKN